MNNFKSKFETFRYISDVDITSLKNSVSANILGIPFPFVGVDGEDACKYISKLDGSKIGCNLKAGEEYVYKNQIEVLRIYPKVIGIYYYSIYFFGINLSV